MALQLPCEQLLWNLYRCILFRLRAVKIKRQAHNLFRSHDLTLIIAGILLQKKMDSAARVFFVFPFALSIVNITHLF